MDGMSCQNVDAFVQIISDILKETLQTMQNRTEQYYDGIVTVVSSDNTLASVDIGDTTFENLSNKTGESLSKDDTVRIFTTTITNSDAYIGVKLN